MADNFKLFDGSLGREESPGATRAATPQINLFAPNDDESDYDEEEHYDRRSYSATPSVAASVSEVTPAIRTPGGRAAAPKRIGKVLDFEDQTIFDMKQQGYTDRAVANHLTTQGYTKYQPQSISSRFIRIRKVMADRNEELLHEELSDWHEGEDEVLMDAYAKADRRVLSELAKTRDKRWQYVAQEINNGIVRPRFSAKACKNRYDDLQNGTARPPPELDDEPEARRKEQIQKRKQFELRKQREAERKKQDDLNHKTLNMSELRKENSRAYVIEKSAKIAQRKADEKRQKDAITQQKRDAKERKDATIQEYRQENARQAEEKKLEGNMLKELRKKLEQSERQKAVNDAAERAQRQRDAAHASASANPRYVPIQPRPAQRKPQVDSSSALHLYGTSNPSRAAKNVTNDRIRAEALDTTRHHREEQLFDAGNAEVGMSMLTAGAPVLSRKRGASMFDADDEEDDVSIGRPARKIQRNAPSTRPPSSGMDPREVMSRHELYAIILERKLPTNRKKEVKDVVLKRINEHDQQMTIAEIQGYLHNKHKKSIKGNKQELIRRLAEADARASPLFKPKHEAILNAANNFAAEQARTRRAVPGTPSFRPARRQRAISGAAPLRSAGPTSQARSREDIDGAEPFTPMPRPNQARSRDEIDDAEAFTPITNFNKQVVIDPALTGETTAGAPYPNVDVFGTTNEMYS